MYGIAGERELGEAELDWLPGYENSGPVRVGNGAAHQLQLDVYGEVTEALHLAHMTGLARNDYAIGAPAQADPATWRSTGTSRTRASGRCAGRAGTSSTPR